MPNSAVPTNLTKAHTEAVLRQGEVRLEAQLTIALAADRRATTITAAFLALASAGIAFGTNTLISEQPSLQLGWAAIAAGVVYAIAAGVSLLTARPTGFRLAGANPENWWDDDVLGRPIEECQYLESLNYSRRIEKNDTLLKDNALLMIISLWFGVAAPIVGLNAWFYVPTVT